MKIYLPFIVYERCLIIIFGVHCIKKLNLELNDTVVNGYLNPLIWPTRSQGLLQLFTYVWAHWIIRFKPGI